MACILREQAGGQSSSVRSRTDPRASAATSAASTARCAGRRQRGRRRGARAIHGARSAAPATRPACAARRARPAAASSSRSCDALPEPPVVEVRAEPGWLRTSRIAAAPAGGVAHQAAPARLVDRVPDQRVRARRRTATPASRARQPRSVSSPAGNAKASSKPPRRSSTARGYRTFAVWKNGPAPSTRSVRANGPEAVDARRAAARPGPARRRPVAAPAPPARRSTPAPRRSRRP